VSGRGQACHWLMHVRAADALLLALKTGVNV